MGTSDVLKALKIARNARAGSYDLLFIIFSAKLLHRATLHALRTTKNTSMGSKMLTCFI